MIWIQIEDVQVQVEDMHVVVHVFVDNFVVIVVAVILYENVIVVELVDVEAVALDFDMDYLFVVALVEVA